MNNSTGSVCCSIYFFYPVLYQKQLQNKTFSTFLRIVYVMFKNNPKFKFHVFYYNPINQSSSPSYFYWNVESRLVARGSWLWEARAHMAHDDISSRDSIPSCIYPRSVRSNNNRSTKI